MTTELMLAIINMGGLVVIAALNYLSNRKTHNLVNSRMTEMLDLTRISAHAAGMKEELDKFPKGKK